MNALARSALRNLAVGLAAAAFAVPATALELNSCHTEATARQLLAAEGQRITASPTNDQEPVWTTVNDADRGYILRRRSDGRYCVVAVMPVVSGLSQSDLQYELCQGPTRRESAKAACDKLQAANFRSTGTRSARSNTSSLADPMTGPVIIESVFCQVGGRRVLCALTETAAESPDAGRR